jgi:hypothetical protein
MEKERVSVLYNVKAGIAMKIAFSIINLTYFRIDCYD